MPSKQHKAFVQGDFSSCSSRRHITDNSKNFNQYVFNFNGYHNVILFYFCDAKQTRPSIKGDHSHTHTHTHTHTQAHMHTQTYVQTHTYSLTHTVCVFVRVFVCTGIYSIWRTLAYLLKIS